MTAHLVAQEAMICGLLQSALAASMTIQMTELLSDEGAARLRASLLALVHAGQERSWRGK